VIDNEVDWAKRVDLLGVATETGHSISHGSEVNYSWNTTIEKVS